MGCCSARDGSPREVCEPGGGRERGGERGHVDLSRSKVIVDTLGTA